MTTMTDPLGHAATYVYNYDDQLTDTTDRDGRRVTYSYDSGRPGDRRDLVQQLRRQDRPDHEHLRRRQRADEHHATTTRR